MWCESNCSKTCHRSTFFLFWKSNELQTLLLILLMLLLQFQLPLDGICNRKWLLRAITFSHICYCREEKIVCRQRWFKRSKQTNEWVKMQQITFLCDLTDQRIRHYYTLGKQKRQFVSKHTFCSSFLRRPIERKYERASMLCSIYARFPLCFSLIKLFGEKKREQHDAASIHSIQFDQIKGNTLHTALSNFLRFLKENKYKWNWTCDRSSISTSICTFDVI